MKPINVVLSASVPSAAAPGTFSTQRGRDYATRRASDPDYRGCRQERRTGETGDGRGLQGDRRRLRRRRDPGVDIVVELIGGYGIAREVVMQSIANGKHVVTANKALLAVHGTEIFTAAQQKGVMVAFEAAVAGGIPIIKALREGLTANRIEWAAGIINGTTNFILSEMRDKGLSFDTVLKEAQRLGYAEADPTFDIEGSTPRTRQRLIAPIAFGIPVQFDKAYVEGITNRASDIRYAEQLSAIASSCSASPSAAKRNTAVELRVHPTLIPAKRLLANVEGAMNAVVGQGDAVGTTLYYGRAPAPSRPPRR